MVVGGWDNDGLHTEAEIVSLEPNRPVPKCIEKVAPFPYGVKGAVGGIALESEYTIFA